MSYSERKVITRDMLRAEPNTLFAFGDNMKERGLGGQAKEMRGEPNAVGIPTKWEPTKAERAFFINSDLPAVEGLIRARLQILSNHMTFGGKVVWPKDGIGTGLAELQKRAPAIWRLIESERKAMASSRVVLQEGK